MDITTDRVSPDTAVVSLEGELDASNYRLLIDAGRSLYADGVRRLVLDLAALTYMSSSGIVALHSLLITFRGGSPPDPDDGMEVTSGIGREAAAGGPADEIRLVAPQAIVQRGLKRTGFADVLGVYPDRAAALA